ncbi:MAG: tRNA uridine-5-carboxymethylaminomethyl(34) synthesis GTPase MnmE [Alphaproteobacteria bacterium]|nr:tRNA uridine-5-carboxymethylaminomethyl(34) synthesis GTPase MnmE [Alphaproteobacteria bacterium]
MRQSSDTIYAVSSGPGRGAIAVIRLSGGKSGETLTLLSGRAPGAVRRAVVRELRHPRTGEPLDQALTLFLPAPASFTGEDMAELHVHGGRAVLAGVLDALAALGGLRPAEPGEFARRAFDHGRLDLVAAEGLADLVAAETAAQRRQALTQMGGALGALYDGWRTAIIELMALAEAGLDFSDQDLPAGLDDKIKRGIDRLVATLSVHLNDGRRGELVRDGLEIAILGPPNAGKSSLLNAIARRDVAIVAATAGTTRDVVEIKLDLGGYPVLLADTAGLREAIDEVEAEGVKRALARAERADLKLIVLDGATWPVIDPNVRALIDSNAIVILNKVDLLGAATPPSAQGIVIAPVSCRTGSGLEGLLACLENKAATRMTEAASPALTQVRYRRALEDAKAALLRAHGAPGVELCAEDLRLASRALGRITGRVDVEDVLDEVFRSFCIGK